MLISDILQPIHLVLILVVVLLVLGPKRLPEASRAFGRTIRVFRGALSGQPAESVTVSQAGERAPIPAGPTG
ncbi:MAG: twin-arginine translocase TatA/TatE family subunit [Solirubrobacteraceae bacterium]